MNTHIWLYAGLIGGALSILAALVTYKNVLKYDAGSARAQEIAGWIRAGASTYLKLLYKTLIALAIILGIILAIVFSGVEKQNHGLLTAGAFAFGALCSALAGWLGMKVAVEANVRTAVACKEGVPQGFNVAFGPARSWDGHGRRRRVRHVAALPHLEREIILGFSFGASLLALLAKAGGGIYTKTADISADLVGKVEVGIPEDDPRNPAVIADNVGDNVGDVAGMGADIFDSYVAAVVAAMLLGVLRSRASPASVRLLPFLCVIDILSTFIGLPFVRVGET